MNPSKNLHGLDATLTRLHSRGVLLVVGLAFILASCGAEDTGAPHAATAHVDHVREVDTGNFQTEVLNSKVPVLVTVGASWCGPCRQLAPTIEAVCRESQGRYKVVHIDADASAPILDHYDVQNLPTLLVIHQGRVVGRMVGNRPKTEITQALSRAVY